MVIFELVMRGGAVVTAADTVVRDVGIEAGKLAALAEHLAPGDDEIDALGRTGTKFHASATPGQTG